jgi:hypothetical protein
MSVTNYGELKSTIADFLNRSDLTSVIPTFIDFAEAEFNRNLRVRQMVLRAEAQIDARFSAVPADFIEAKDLVIVTTNPVQPLEFITQQEMAQERNTTYTAASTPRYFSVVGGQFEFVPTPDQQYSLEMSYFAKIPALSADTDTNWLLTDYPDIYLYTSLMHSAPYLKDDERIGVWSQLAAKAREELIARDASSSFNGSTPRIKIRSFG